MLTRAKDFDVIATMNLNGDYLSDALAAQVRSNLCSVRDAAITVVGRRLAALVLLQEATPTTRLAMPSSR